MSSTDAGKSASRGDYWRAQMEAQERSGKSVARFCKDQGVTEQAFYFWRKRLRNQQPVRFAVLETEVVRQQVATEVGLELVLATGERLRIGAGVESATLRRVLEALRG
jgi:transposase-like protein